MESGFYIGKCVVNKINKLLETHFVNLNNGNDFIRTSYDRRLRTMGKLVRKVTVPT